MKISTDIRKHMRGILAELLIVCMIAGNTAAVYAATQEATAVSVKMLQSEGTVELRNLNGRALSVVEGMRLYHGYRVLTQESSYAYMGLDENRLATLDAVSDMELERKDDDLVLLLNSGRLFFDVAEKLDEDETMSIHTSNVALGIRGTSGLVELVGLGHTRVWLFEGKIDAVVTNPINNQRKEIHMVSGMVTDFYVHNMDYAGDKCEIAVRNYHESEVPGFVLREMKKNLKLVERIKQSGGGDFYPYLDRAEERLKADEAQMHEKIEKIRLAYQEQPHVNHTVPVFPSGDTSGDSDGESVPAQPSVPEQPTAPTQPDDPAEPEVYENATLLAGSQINQKFQELLNDADSRGLTWSTFGIRAYAGAADLKAIRYASEAPSSDLYTVTLEASGSPVYAWYRSGTIYLYSDAPKILLASDGSGLLKGFYGLTDISGLEKFDAANVTDLSDAFSTLRGLTDFSPISGWDVSSVTDLSYAFSGCTAMKDLSALSSWNIGQVTDLSYTFAYNTALTSVDGIKDWNTSSVKVLDNIFSGCSGLADASGLSVHSMGDYTAWDVKATFKNATKAEQFADTKVAVDAGYSGYPDWFMKTYSFIGDDGNTEIYTASIPIDATDLSAALQNQLADKAPAYLKNWNTSADGSGTVLGGSESSALITEDTYFYYQPLEATLVTGKKLKEAIEDAAYGSRYVHAIAWSDTPPGDDVTNRLTISEAGSDRDVVCWYEGDSSGGTVYLYGAVKTVYLNPDSSKAFEAFEKLTDISGLAHLDCSKVTDLSYAFHSDWNLKDLSPVKDWDTSSVTSLKSTFGDLAAQIGGLDNYDALANWDTGNVTSMESTFADHVCKDISGLAGWDTSKVVSFQGTFATGARGTTFDNVNALAGWNTGSAKTMRSMFSSCDSLQNVDGLSEWDVSNVTDMSGMFISCTSLTDIDGLAQWTTSNVQDFSQTFRYCSGLGDLSALQGWNVKAAVTMKQMFNANDSLADLKPLAGWEPIICTDFSEMFDSCDALKDATCLDSWKVDSGANVSWFFNKWVTTSLPWWYQNGRLVTEQISALTLDAGTGTVELSDIAPASSVTFYTAAQQMSESVPDPEIVGEEYITDAVELPEAEHESAMFEAWNTRADGSGTSYQAGEVFLLNGDTTLYAIWDASDATPSNATLSNAVPSRATASDAAPFEASSDAGSTVKFGAGELVPGEGEIDFQREKRYTVTRIRMKAGGAENHGIKAGAGTESAWGERIFSRGRSQVYGIRRKHLLLFD